MVGFIKEAVESSRWLMPPPKGTVWDEDEQGFVPQGHWYDDYLGEWVPNGYHWEKDNEGNYSLFHDNNDEEGDEEGSDEDGDDDEGDDKPEVSGNEKKEKVDSDSSSAASPAKKQKKQ